MQETSYRDNRVQYFEKVDFSPKTSLSSWFKDVISENKGVDSFEFQINKLYQTINSKILPIGTGTKEREIQEYYVFKEFNGNISRILLNLYKNKISKKVKDPNTLLSISYGLHNYFNINNINFKYKELRNHNLFTEAKYLNSFFTDLILFNKGYLLNNIEINNKFYLFDAFIENIRNGDIESFSKRNKKTAAIEFKSSIYLDSANNLKTFKSIYNIYSISEIINNPNLLYFENSQNDKELKFNKKVEFLNKIDHMVNYTKIHGLPCYFIFLPKFRFPFDSNFSLDKMNYIHFDKPQIYLKPYGFDKVIDKLDKLSTRQ